MVSTEGGLKWEWESAQWIPICIIRIMENSGDVYCKQRNQEATAMYLQK